METKDGSIIATIITTHIPRNDAAAPDHVCPGIRIHAIDIVQPPGIGISPIADMDAHQTIVTAALEAKSSAATVAALLFASSAAVTIVWCASMSAMGEMPMPGGWTMSMAWMRMPGQTWSGAAASFLGMWVVMMVAMMLP